MLKKEIAIAIAAFAAGALVTPFITAFAQDALIFSSLDQLVRDGSYDQPVPRYGFRRSSPRGRDVAFRGLEGEPLYIRYMFRGESGSLQVYDCAGSRIELARDYVVRSLEKTRTEAAASMSYFVDFCGPST